MPEVRLSLLLPALNSERYIGRALDSVAEQLAPLENDAVEVVVADGGSADATTDVARRYPFVRVLDGTDSGIYHGFNRALEAARGDVIGFLNSDDALAPGTLANLAEHLRDVDVLSGGVTIARDGEQVPVLQHDVRMEPASIMFGIPAVNGRFMRRDILVEAGGFRPEAGLASDRELLLRLARLPLRRRLLRQPVYQYRVHEGSATIAGDRAAASRVWAAEIQLCAYLLGESGLPPAERAWAGRSLSLARAKSWLSSERMAPGLSPADLVSLPAAVVAWRRWRGRLSGW